MIKKISDKDQKDWIDFLNSNEKLENKDLHTNKKKNLEFNEKTIDLHGYTLDEANKFIHHFILSSYENNIKKIKIITGKGLRSKNKDNPYQSENLSMLKYSVPEYINSNPELLKVIKSINQQEVESINSGSFEILLKKKL